MSLLSFNALKKNLKKDVTTFPQIRIAVVGDCAIQLVVTAIKGYAIECGFNPDIFEAEYAQIEQQLLNPQSRLYQFEPDFIIVVRSPSKLFTTFSKLALSNKKSFWKKELKQLETYYAASQTKSSYRLILCNYPEINDSVFGNYANKTSNAFLYQLRKLNCGTMELCEKSQNLFICDLSSLQNQMGRNQFFNPKLHIMGDSIFSFEALPLVAKLVLDIIRSIRGQINKCLILDLDNTLWGGVIGDDGLERIEIGELGIGKAFTDLQIWIKQLQERGVILAVCSKNNESIAKEPFEKHPDMVLKLKDISIFVANWENKVDNIHHIQSVLNIGFDSMVFLDDNPFERTMVKEKIPEITVPNLPEDPVEFLEFLQTQNLFETASFVSSDKKRTRQYQEESQRKTLLKSYNCESDFLANLNMQIIVTPFTPLNIPRVAQLTQRSNQFNLRSIRYTEEDIQRFSTSDQYQCFAFTLSDKFGAYGLVSAIILEKQKEKLFINTWIMSCRVLNRGLENRVLEELLAYAQKYGYSQIVGEYIPTQKNQLVADLFTRLGFVKREAQWVILSDTKKTCRHFIKTAQTSQSD